MSIQNEIDRITNNVAEAYAAVEEKGGSVPEEANSDKLAEAIRSIESGEAAAYAVNAPIGAIILWSGPESTIPSGWHICDGTNGTEDLRGRFVLGATTEVDEDGNTDHPVGETGGEEEVTLTVGQMPKHRHSMLNMFTMTSYGTGVSTSNYRIGKPDGSTPTTSYSGSSEPHPNMPPYLALYYIQKISATPTDYTTREDVEELVGLPVKPITEAEYSALSDEDKNGETAWLVTDAEGSGGNGDDGSDSDGGEIYSLEEVRIGTWIDDKPLYRIVKQGILPSTTNAWNKIVEIPNMDRLLFAQISVYVNVSSVKYTLYDHTTGVGQLDQWVVFYNPSSGSYSSKEYLLTIKYTKTTD